jgi:hypothetical protein
MQRKLRSLCLVALFGIFLPAFADDTSDSTPKPDAKDKKQLDKLVKSGKSFFGKLIKIDADKQVLTVEVKSPKKNPQAVQNLANLQIQMAEAQRQRNPVERLRQLNHLQVEIDKNTLNLYKDETFKVELEAPENMTVRTLVLPVELDDKGKPRKLTEKEKRELKGPDATLPGYTADFDSLKTDQTVEIYLAKQPPKSKAKDKDADNMDVIRPKIAMIVIRAEAKK